MQLFEVRVNLGAMAMNEYLIFPRALLTGILPLNSLMSYQGHSLRGVILPLCRDAVGVFYSPIVLLHGILLCDCCWGVCVCVLSVANKCF